MALSECNTTVDASGRELLQHGTVDFPIACYHDDFTNMDVPWHWHEEFEAVLITKGTCTVAAGNERKVISAGEGFFINSEILHGCWDTEKTGCVFHSLVFHPRLVGGSLDSVFHHSYIAPLLAPSAPEFTALSPDIPWQNAALSAIETAWQSYVQDAPGFEFRVRNALSELVFLLCSNLPASAPQASRKTLRDAERIKIMLGYIHSHFGEELTTKAIAASALISESEALRCFRSTIGISPIQYLKQYRIQQAALELAASQEAVADIASRCGFQDMSYFTKSFREAMGMTPSQYRKTKTQRT